MQLRMHVSFSFGALHFSWSVLASSGGREGGGGGGREGGGGGGREGGGRGDGQTCPQVIKCNIPSTAISKTILLSALYDSKRVKVWYTSRMNVAT